jgi:hypothetical protein
MDIHQVRRVERNWQRCKTCLEGHMDLYRNMPISLSAKPAPDSMHITYP